METLFSIIEWFLVIMSGIILGLAWHLIELRVLRRRYERERESAILGQRRHERRGWMLCLTGRKGELKLRRS
jgi:hypothetical protein